MANGFARLAIVLGLLAAMAPFAIDTYLPALPTIAADLGTSIALAQASLMSFFVAIGICQIVCGPVSDMVGRRPPLYFGLGLFVVASLGCAIAPNIETLIAFRFIQGIGACAGIVISRAIVRDLYTGPDAARLMSFDHACLQRGAGSRAAVGKRLDRDRWLACDFPGHFRDRFYRHRPGCLMRFPRLVRRKSGLRPAFARRCVITVAFYAIDTISASR
jgi:hypothetical protein